MATIVPVAPARAAPWGRAALRTPSLVDGLRAGSRDAFEQLYELYRARIYNLALRIVQSPEDARDITQDVFVKVYRRLPGSRLTDLQLKPWLYRVAVNACYDHLRTRKVHRDIDIGERHARDARGHLRAGRDDASGRADAGRPLGAPPDGAGAQGHPRTATRRDRRHPRHLPRRHRDAAVPRPRVVPGALRRPDQRASGAFVHVRARRRRDRRRRRAQRRRAAAHHGARRSLPRLPRDRQDVGRRRRSASACSSTASPCRPRSRAPSRSAATGTVARRRRRERRDRRRARRERGTGAAAPECPAGSAAAGSAGVAAGGAGVTASSATGLSLVTGGLLTKLGGAATIKIAALVVAATCTAGGGVAAYEADVLPGIHHHPTTPAATRAHGGAAAAKDGEGAWTPPGLATATANGGQGAERSAAAHARTRTRARARRPRTAPQDEGRRQGQERRPARQGRHDGNCRRQRQRQCRRQRRRGNRPSLAASRQAGQARPSRTSPPSRTSRTSPPSRTRPRPRSRPLPGDARERPLRDVVTTDDRTFVHHLNSSPRPTDTRVERDCDKAVRDSFRR